MSKTYDKEEIISLYKDGYSYREIGEKIGVSHVTVSKIIKESGVKINETSYISRKQQKNIDERAKAATREKVCEYCNKKFTTKRPEYRFCSRTCSGKYNKNKQIEKNTSNKQK